MGKLKTKEIGKRKFDNPVMSKKEISKEDSKQKLKKNLKNVVKLEPGMIQNAKKSKPSNPDLAERSKVKSPQGKVMTPMKPQESAKKSKEVSSQKTTPAKVTDSAKKLKKAQPQDSSPDKPKKLAKQSKKAQPQDSSPDKPKKLAKQSKKARVEESKPGKAKELTKKETKKEKKKLKNKSEPSLGDEVPEGLQQELEVLIKNLNRNGELQKHFVVDDDSVQNEDDDEIMSDEDYENFDDDQWDEEKVEEITPKEEPVESAKVEKKSKKEKVEKASGKLEKSLKKELSKSDSDALRAQVDDIQKVKGSNPESKVKVETANLLLDRADYIFTKEVPKERKYCLMRPKGGEPWHKILEPKPEIENLEVGQETSDYWIGKIEKYTKKILEEDIANFVASSNKDSKKSSEKRFMETVLKSGTMIDKISAYVVMIQESPVHNLATLQTLIDMVSLKSRRPCMLALDALQNLFANSLLIPDRKLRTFAQCPIRHLDKFSGGNRDTRDKYLMIWLFENQMKTMFAKFLEALAEIGKDTIENTRAKVMTVSLELLVSTPEQEQELLSRLVNKLGDPARKVASKATYQIGVLLEKHSAMKEVVLSEIERLIHRSNIAPRAQYYGICCLTQLVLRDDNDLDKKIANKLITIYFSFFKASIKKGDIDTKLVSALLTGVHRAFPFAIIDEEAMNAQMETMYKIAHMSTFNIAIHAFMLLFQVMGSGGETVTDRFYNAFYKKLLCPDLPNTSKPALFLNLSYKVIKNDPSPNRVLAFMKRLLQLMTFWPTSLVCSTLFLISEVLKARPEISLTNKAEENFSDEKGSNDMTRFDDDGDADDYRKDVSLSDEDEKSEKKDPKTGSSTKGSWIHRNLSKNQVHGSKATCYNPTDRNPQYAGAEKSNFWELSSYVNHVHPSASFFAKTLLEGQDIKYTGDPLADFELMRFLDRFVFRNPKKEPLKNKPTNVFSKRSVYQAPSGIKSLAPDSKEYIDRDESQVPLDERFIYRFFADKRTRVSDAQDSDAESVNSDDAMEALEMYGEAGAKDLDFASALESDTKKGKKRKSDSDDELDLDDDDESDVDSLLESGDDEQAGSDEDELIQDDSDDFEEIDDFEGMEDDFEATPAKIAAKKLKKTQKISKQKALSGEFFASADEFAELIDENEKDFDAGSSQQVSNKDRSTVKQLAWETDRHSDFKKKFGAKKFAPKGKAAFKGKKFQSKIGKKK